MKTSCRFTHPSLFLFTLFSLICSPLLWAESPADEGQKREVQIQQKKEAIEIKAKERLAAMESQTQPVEQIQERKFKIPEIPQPLRDRELSPAEKVQLDSLEQQYASGRISEMEYQMKRDALERQANVKF